MDEKTRTRRRRRRGRDAVAPAARAVDYRRLTSPLPIARGYSDDQIADIHATALTVLEELGVQVNHDGARDLLVRAGAAVDGQQVRFGREMVEAAIASSPPEFTLTGGNGTLAIGGRTATERAHDLWRQVLAEFRPPAVDRGTVEAIDAFIARRVEEGGAAPVS